MFCGSQQGILIFSDLIKIDSVITYDRVIQGINEERWLDDILDSVGALSLLVVIQFIFEPKHFCDK